MAFIVAKFGSAFLWIVCYTNLSLFLKNAMKIEIQENGLLTSLPSIFSLIIGNLADVLIDFVQNRGWMSPIPLRKSVYVFALVPASLCFQ